MIVRTFVSALAFFLACAGCQRKADRPLIVGMELKYPPFEMTDGQGHPAGVSVEIAQALGAHLGRAIRIENMPFDGLLPSLKTGRIDLIISSMTATEERAKSIDFSEPYLRTGLALLVAKDSPVQGIADLNAAGRAVAVKQGTTGHLYAEGNLKQARLLVLADETSAVLEVVQGKADAFIYDQMSVYQNWKKNAGRTRAILTPFKEEGWAIGIRKGDGELRGKVNAFLEKFRAEGSFERLGDKYLAEQKKAFAQMGTPFFF
jgi:polar amino acid transport system substrate-binding protein